MALRGGFCRLRSSCRSRTAQRLRRRTRAATLVAQQQNGSDKDSGEDQRSGNASNTGIGGLKKGQGTAIVTGAISLLIGVAYLALASALNNRGLVRLSRSQFLFGPSLILVIVSLTVPRILISFLRCHHLKRRSANETLFPPKLCFDFRCDSTFPPSLLFFGCALFVLSLRR